MGKHEGQKNRSRARKRWADNVEDLGRMGIQG